MPVTSPRDRLTRSLARAAHLATRNAAQKARLQKGAAQMADHATRFVDQQHAAGATDDDATGMAVTRALRGRYLARQLAARD